MKEKKFNLLKRSLVFGLMACQLLSGCNDNSSSTEEPEPIPEPITEVALINYLKGAKTCLDINANLSCDDDEPVPTVDDQGNAIISVEDYDNYTELFVVSQVVPEVTIDTNLSDKVLRLRYTLVAPLIANEKQVVISPLSTLVSMKIIESGLSMTEALADIGNTIGLANETEVELLRNYIELKSDNVELSAKLVAYAQNTAQALARLTNKNIAALDAILQKVHEIEDDGKDIALFSVFPLGNIEDENFVLIERDSDGNILNNETQMVCSSKPENHVQTDITDPVNDPLNPYQWHLHGGKEWIEQEGEELIADGSDINAAQTYMAGYTGACVKVAVVDTSVSLEHPDLIANMIPFGSVNTGKMVTDAEFVTADTFDPRPDKWGASFIQGHGTSVSGVIASTANNSEGGRGVAPGALIRSFGTPIPFPPQAEAKTKQEAKANNKYPKDLQAAIALQKLTTANKLTRKSAKKVVDQSPKEDPSGDFFKAQTYLLGDALFAEGLAQFSDVDLFNYSGSLYNENPLYQNMPTIFRESLKAGVNDLRDGKGAIYMMSSGNGNKPNPYCRNFSMAIQNGQPAYLPCWTTANASNHATPYTMSIAAHNSSALISSYSTTGSSVWISAPSNDRYSINETETLTLPGILATDIQGCEYGFASSTEGRSEFERGNSDLNPKCDYVSFGGTSSSAPVLTGVVALLLEKHPWLNWRQVKYVLAKSANKLNPELAPMTISVSGEDYIATLGWQTNAAGFNYHNSFGFGGVNTDGAMAIADLILAGVDTFGLNLQQQPFEELDWLETAKTSSVGTVPDNSIAGLASSLTVPTNDARVIESVQVYIDLTGTRLSDLSIELISPEGTKSIIWSARNKANEFEYPSEMISFARMNSSSGGEENLELKVADKHGDNVFIGDELSTKPEFSSMSFYNKDGSKKRYGYVLLSNQFFGETSEGIWKLKIVDTATGIQTWEDVKMDWQTYQPVMDENSEYVLETHTSKNPTERFLRRWGLKVFGHKPE